MESEYSLGTAYRIIGKIGNGGNGTVYKVRHISTEQIRAAKKLQASLDGNLYHEIQMMKRLHHPGLPLIYDVVEAQGEIWLIMEYIQGKCLSALRLEERTEDVFFSVARQLSQTLIYLHSRTPPVFHLDIKPTNVIMRQDGSVVLIDFGAAMRKKYNKEAGAVRNAHDSMDNGLHGNFMGTPGFAAPEQFLSGAGLDERTDLYGFCATLYYLLYGKIYRPEEETSEKIQLNPQNASYKTLSKLFQQRPQTRSHKKIWQMYAEKILKSGLSEAQNDRPKHVWVLVGRLKQAEFLGRCMRQWKTVTMAVCFLVFSTVFTAQSYLTMTVDEEVRKRQNNVLQTEYDTERESCEESGNARMDYAEQAGLLGVGQALPYYQKAAAQEPKDPSWCLELMSKIMEDGVFDMEEEKGLNELLYGKPTDHDDRTLLEVWKDLENPEMNSVMREVAFQIGLAYWHCYSGSGGKSAAANWFEMAASGEDGQDNLAVLYQKVASSYFELDQQGGGGQETSAYAKYFRTLKEIYDQNAENGMNLQIQRHLVDELLSALIFHSREIRSCGIEKEEVCLLIEQFIQDKAALYQDKTEQKSYLEKCQAALEAVDRNE